MMSSETYEKSDVEHICHEMRFMEGKLDYICDTLQINDSMLLLIMDEGQWRENCALDALYGIIATHDWYHI